MSKNARNLDAIAADIHRIGRKHVADTGKLLAEAKAACEHGDWIPWLEAEFEWSERTATRYIAVAELVAKSDKLSDLKLATTTLYRLTDEELLPHLEPIIAALAKASGGKTLKAAAAQDVIDTVALSAKYGRFPLATLKTFNDNDFIKDEPWVQKAFEQLRRQKPEELDVAKAVVDAAYEQHLHETDASPEDDKIEEEDPVEDVVEGPTEDVAVADAIRTILGSVSETTVIQSFTKTQIEQAAELLHSIGGAPRTDVQKIADRAARTSEMNKRKQQSLH